MTVCCLALLVRTLSGFGRITRGLWFHSVGSLNALVYIQSLWSVSSLFLTHTPPDDLIIGSSASLSLQGARSVSQAPLLVTGCVIFNGSLTFAIPPALTEGTHSYPIFTEGDHCQGDFSEVRVTFEGLEGCGKVSAARLTRNSGVISLAFDARFECLGLASFRGIISTALLLFCLIWTHSMSS